MIREEERKKERKDGYKQQERHYLQGNLPDNNRDYQSLPDWVTVVKNQILETLSTNTENWWKEFRGHLGRVTRNNYYWYRWPEFPGERFLTAAEEKERDFASKKSNQNHSLQLLWSRSMFYPPAKSSLWLLSLLTMPSLKAKKGLKIKSEEEWEDLEILISKWTQYLRFVSVHSTYEDFLKMIQNCKWSNCLLPSNSTT